MVTVRERVRIFTPELQLRTRTGLGGTRRMLCVTGPQIWFRRHPRPNLAQGSWVQRARPQVTGPARPCDRQRLGQRAQGTVLRRAPCQERNRQNLSRRKPGRHCAADEENHLQLRQRGSAARAPSTAPTTAQPPAAPGALSSTTRNSSRAPPSVATRKTSTTLLATCVSRTHS